MSRFSLRTAALLGLTGVALTAGQALATPIADPPPAQPAAATTVTVPGAGTPAPNTTTAAAKPTAKPVKKPAGPAQAVVVVRTGGIAGGSSVFTLVGAGSDAHSAATIRLASSAAFKNLRARYIPKNECCDRFHYTVEVGYRNGAKKKIVALQGAPGTPKVLLDVIRLMETMPEPEPIRFPAGFPFN
jgi:hypothetical protein